jgi:sugar lactone lactonase YvrE
MRLGVKRPLVALVAVAALIVTSQVLPSKVHAQVSTPRIRSVEPRTITAGAPTFTMRVGGTRFEAGTQVVLDGTPLPNTTVTDFTARNFGRELLVDIDSSIVANPGTHTVSALNPDGGATPTIDLTVIEPDPDVFIRLGGNSTDTDPGQPLQISIFGQGFTPLSTGLFWGHRSPLTTFQDDSDLTMELQERFLGQPARIPIMVTNGQHSFSNTEVFFVVPQPPKVQTVNPDTVTVGTSDVPLVVTGTNIIDNEAQLVVNGQVLATTVVETAGGTKLEATVPSTLFSTPSELVVRIQQGQTQSKGDKTLDVTPSAAPYIFTFAPNRMPVGLPNGATFRKIQIVGANFVVGSRGLIDGQPVHFVRVDRHTFNVKLRPDFVATPGTHTCQIIAPNGTPSNTVSFVVEPDAVVSTVSGGHIGFETGCVPSAEARYQGPRRLALGPNGLLYITDQLSSAVRTLDTSSGEVCTIAGTGHFGYADSGNPRGFQPSLSYPNGVVVGSDGAVYISDNLNNVIRMVQQNTDGTSNVQTYAGSWVNMTDPAREARYNATKIGIDGFLDGPLNQSLIRQADDMVIGPDGTMYFADAENNTIRRIRQTVNGPVVETLAGNGVPGYLDGIGGDAQLQTPTGIALSPDGTVLYVADLGNNVIRRLNLQTLLLDTYAGSADSGKGDGPNMIATFNGPFGLAVDTDGTVYVSEVGNSRIRRVDTQQNVSTVAGTSSANLRDGPGVQAQFKNLRGIALDSVNRVIYAADFSDFAIRKVQLPQ